MGVPGRRYQLVFLIRPARTELVFKSGANAVSYTHLDVYKRQQIIVCNQLGSLVQQSKLNLSTRNNNVK